MAQKNQISAAIADTDKQEVIDSIDALRSKLNPVTPFNLSADERLALNKMGDKTLAFVTPTWLKFYCFKDNHNCSRWVIDQQAKNI
jgi:hypothetical protein